MSGQAGKRAVPLLKFAGGALGIGAVMFAVILAALARPAETARGELVEISSYEGRRSGTHITLRMEGGRHYTWSCNSRACRRAQNRLQSRDIRWSLPAPAEILLRGGVVTGLRINGASIIDDRADVGRRQWEAFGFSILFGAFLNLTLLWIRQGWLRRRALSARAMRMART